MPSHEQASLPPLPDLGAHKQRLPLEHLRSAAHSLVVAILDHRALALLSGAVSRQAQQRGRRCFVLRAFLRILSSAVAVVVNPACAVDDSTETTVQEHWAASLVFDCTAVTRKEKVSPPARTPQTSHTHTSATRTRRHLRARPSARACIRDVPVQALVAASARANLRRVLTQIMA